MMKKYSYEDFVNTLEKSRHIVMTAINTHINLHYPAYKPFEIKPTDKSEKEWKIHYRKKPKVGKPICSVYSNEGRLSVRFSFLSSMTHEYLLRQNEFSEKFQKNALKQIICVVNNSCRSYGGNSVCQYRQYFWLNDRIIMACPYPWVRIDDCSENDILDINLLIDVQMKHMIQDPKDIKGASYYEENNKRCKEVQSIILDKINLDIDVFQISDHVKKAERLNKYTKLYNLVPMGEKDGLWFYFSNNSIGGMNNEKYEYSHNEIPKGRYAMVTIEDPFTFSLNRIWNYVCKCIYDKKENIKGIILNNNENTACFARFFAEGEKEFMSLYVPIQPEP